MLRLTLCMSTGPAICDQHPQALDGPSARAPSGGHGVTGGAGLHPAGRGSRLPTRPSHPLREHQATRTLAPPPPRPRARQSGQGGGRGCAKKALGREGGGKVMGRGQGGVGQPGKAVPLARQTT